jgi:ATP-binding cassette subfamily C protein
MRLLLGFELPEVGTIRYDGKDLESLDPRALRRQMGVVTQSARLMAGDIFTNIVGARPLSIEDAWEAAEIAGVKADIEALPMGMHTFVAEGAGTFSGGQRQRLLIARAVVGRPRILLFDEATSALDNKTQAAVSEAIERLRATRVVIAHRLSTVRAADKIVVLQAGRIVQQGRYDELIDVEGPFQRLARRQLA